MNKFKRNLILSLALVIVSIISFILLDSNTYIFTGGKGKVVDAKGEEFQQHLSEVIAGEKSPEILTDRVIVKEYDKKGKFSFKSISKREYDEYVKKLSKDKNIEYVQPDFVRYASVHTKSNKGLSWGKERIGTQYLINVIGTTSHKVTVAVLDTGIDYNHEFLKNRVTKGYNFVEGNKDSMDYNSHGTHVAGIIADNTNVNVRIMPVRVLNDKGSGYDSQIANGIYYAVDKGADIINMSLGGPGYSPHMAEAINYAITKNVLVVVSAGNEGSNTELFYPASEKKAVVVSAVDEKDNFTSFSNYGKSVDIAAPGSNIYSSIINNEYASYNGTSMSTPYISAISALIKAEDGKRDVKKIKEILKNHTDDLGILGKDDYFGEGVANVSNYAKETDEFVLISPQKNTTHHDNITMKYYTSNTIGARAIIKINGKVVSSKIISKNGYKTEYVDVKDIGKGLAKLNISIEKDGKALHSKTLNITIESFNTICKAFDHRNQKQNSFEIKIYGIKDNVVKNFQLGLDNEPIYNLNSTTGEIKLNIDYNQMFSLYDNLVIVAADKEGNTMPVYVRELTGAGKYTFKPDNLQKVTFTNELEIREVGIYSSSIYPSYRGVLLPWSGSGTYRLGKEASLYMDEGSHLVSFVGDVFCMSKRVEGAGETKFVLNEGNSTEVKFIGDENLTGVDGFFEENYVLAWLFAREEKLIDLGALILSPGENNYRVYNGNYTLSFVKEVPDKGQLLFYKDFTASKDIDKLIFQYGSSLRSGFKLYYNDNKVKGIVNIKDEYDNILILDNSFYDTHFQNIIPSNISQTINTKPASLNWQTKVILKDIKRKVHYYALVDGNNNFVFDEVLPDGQYQLYTDFKTDIFPFDNKRFQVEIKNNGLISNSKNNRPEIIKDVEDFVVKRYENIEVDLGEIFVDADGDELIFDSNLGYIHNGKFYYTATQLGEFKIVITASDGKSPLERIEFIINVIGGDIILDPDESEYTLFDKQYDVVLDKEWTIRFNRQFKMEEVNEIKLMKGNKEIASLVDYYADKSMAIIRAKDLYEKDRDYYILIKLSNGKKYKINFRTRS